MRPEGFDDPRPLRGADVPSDLAFAELEAELAEAGARARRRGSEAPDPRFAATLRNRLMAQARMPVQADGQSRHAFGPPDDPWAMPADPGPVHHRPAAVIPHLASRHPTTFPASRWTITAAAAALVVALVGLNANLFLPVPAASRVTTAVGAELIRQGETTGLAIGTELRAGDEIRVGPNGSAGLQIGDSRVRLAGSSDVRLTTLDRANITLEQVEGRVWHRVVMPADGRYVVTTGGVSWTARGTAFDLERTTTGSTGDTVHALSVQHAIVASGNGLLVTVQEGHGATVILGDRPSIETTPVDATTAAADPWIRANAAMDTAAGLSVGMLDGLPLAIATAAPTGNTSPAATASPTPTDLVAATTPPPTTPPAATPSPTPRATPRPTPRPTPAPTLGTMGLTTLACPGGVTLDWTVPDMAGINHIQVLRGTSGEIPMTYPLGPGITAIDGGYTTDVAKTSGFDVREVGGSDWYRAVAYSAQNKPIAASDIRSVSTLGPASLGPLGVSGSTPGELTFSWAPLGAAADCFSYYKIVKSADDPAPSYLTGATAIAAIGDQSASGSLVTGLPAGGTYWFRVEAIRATSLGKFVVGASSVVQATIP